MATNQYVVRLVKSVLNNASEKMLEHFVVEMEPEELYAMICGYDTEKLESFSRTAGYLKQSNYLGQIIVPVLMRGRTQVVNMMFNVGLESCARYRQYFVPEVIPTITPESYIYSKLETAMTLAQDWALTKTMFTLLNQILTTDQMANTMPWLKDIGRDAWLECKDIDGNQHEFTDKYDIGWMRSNKFEQVKKAIKRLGYPSNTPIPAMSPRLFQAAKIGGRLMTQWRLKKKEAPKSPGTFVIIAQHDLLLPPWFQPDMDDMLRFWERENDDDDE